MPDLEQAQRRLARWLILRIADAGRPVVCNENVFSLILAGEKLPFATQGLRRQLTYLRDRGVAEIARPPRSARTGR